ncbi:MAG: TetR/AcrR family transcriptional regulator [Candidatus Binatia bacterium]
MARGRLQPTFAKEGENRRTRVLSALFGLICERGYSRTTLADLAAAAGMSPSHLLYYFDSKDAVLVELFELCATKMREDVESLPGETSAARLNALADYFFGGKVMTRRDQSFMLELFGLATHDERLRRIKAGFDRRLKGWLADVFRSARRPSRVSAEDAAEIALATLVGLFTSAYFDERLETAHGRTLFRAVLTDLAGSGARK